MKLRLILFVTPVLILPVISALVIWMLFRAPGTDTKQEAFVIAQNAQESEIVQNLMQQGFIRYPWVFNLALTIKNKHNAVNPGGYYLSKSMNTWQVVDKLSSNPDMKWVVVKEGMRKEQIGELLAKTFGWSNEELDKWNTVYTRMNFDYREGVYFPDTYLIPTAENGLDIANRMISHFNDKFSSYQNEFANQNILWTSGLKIASLIQREAGGKDDMPIIAGVLWNRLTDGMKLQIDATIQYAKGKTGDTWWSTVTPEDIQNTDSPYNTYQNEGLPPTPICNPGLDAIDAVLHPTQTDCLFYLHDNNRQIHCSKTYEEHLQNVQKYLQ